MKRGPQKYSKDLIRSAIKKSEDGASLSSIAKDMGLPKTTIKYWLDNPNKYLAEPSAESPDGKIARVQGKFLDHSWKYVFHLCKILEEKEKDASFRDIVFGITQLTDVVSRIQIVGGHTPLAAPVIEVSEQTSITIRRFLEKKKEMELPSENGGQTVLGGEPADSRPPADESVEVSSSREPIPVENSANG